MLIRVSAPLSPLPPQFRRQPTNTVAQVIAARSDSVAPFGDGRTHRRPEAAWSRRKTLLPPDHVSRAYFNYGIPTDQAEKFKGSVHGEALLKNRDMAAPTCNDCHGNHGAAPPGATS